MSFNRTNFVWLRHWIFLAGSTFSQITWLPVVYVKVQESYNCKCNQSSHPVHKEHDCNAEKGPKKAHPLAIILEWMKQLSAYLNKSLSLNHHLKWRPPTWGLCNGSVKYRKVYKGVSSNKEIGQKSSNCFLKKTKIFFGNPKKDTYAITLRL